MAKKYFTLDKAYFRPDLDSVFRPDGSIFDEPDEDEYCFSSRKLPGEEGDEIIMFLRDKFCGTEPVNIGDAPTEENGWVNYVMAEVAAAKRLVSRFESQEKGKKQ